MVGEVLTYTPTTKILTTSDVNMFLTRHRSLHESDSVPRIPLSISHCWINAFLERKKLDLHDFGYNESAEVSPSLFILLMVGNESRTGTGGQRRRTLDRSNSPRCIQNKIQSRSKSFYPNGFSGRYGNPSKWKYHQTPE
jgi:hypothetical protein